MQDSFQVIKLCYQQNHQIVITIIMDYETHWQSRCTMWTKTKRIIYENGRKATVCFFFRSPQNGSIKNIFASFPPNSNSGMSLLYYLHVLYSKQSTTSQAATDLLEEKEVRKKARQHFFSPIFTRILITLPAITTCVYILYLYVFVG